MWKVGDECYFVANKLKAVHGVIKKIEGEFAIVIFEEHRGVRIRLSRLYHTREECDAELPILKRKNPYDEWA